MRVLIAIWNIPGQLRPMVPLGRALRARGAGPDHDCFAVLRTESAATCSVPINGGGAGSVLTSLVNGVPHLAVSHLPDEAVHGERVPAGQPS
ncbi:hypothetical protein [Nocardia sp. NPDC057030]|uniref:hypothetical protein n=1 Tax=unclassified Nocardia TaxID=2637762 RepID=UPI00363395EA